MVSSSVTAGSTSVVRSGRLLINTAFPRLLIPLAAVRTAFFRFLPTIPVYLILHALFLPEWHPRELLSLYFLAMMVIFSMGIAAFFATLQIYFRDTKSFLPYFTRIWLYLSPDPVGARHAGDARPGRAGGGADQPDVPDAGRLHRPDPGGPDAPARTPGGCRRSGRSPRWSSAACTSSRGSVSLLSVSPRDTSDGLAVRVDHLSITYQTTYERKPTFRQTLIRFGRGQRTVRLVEAIKNVSFDVPNGTAMGIIGANGAGKSTLMRAIAGILPPTKGTIEVWGRASTLLALGVGFNRDLSGRENIVLGGLASGLSRREVEERADEVAEWTELGDFIEMPMRTYSSGMSARVAFSVAVHMKPDILMIDEALSTGDASFKQKAQAKMAELRDSARAMFLVSHGLNSIKEMCTEVLWLDHGTLMMRGEPEEVVEAYMEFLRVKRSATADEDV